MHTKNGDAAVTITTKNKVEVHLNISRCRSKSIDGLTKVNVALVTTFVSHFFSCANNLKREALTTMAPRMESFHLALNKLSEKLFFISSRGTRF